jgi:colanic acid biosynthesis protein WcaH
VAEEELGLGIELAGRLGVYSYFWDTSTVAGVETRHTMNIVYQASPVRPDFEITLDDQHDTYRFVTTATPELHPYMRRYLDDAGNPTP